MSLALRIKQKLVRAEQFTYDKHQLDPDGQQIRLLLLYPGKGNDALKGELSVVDLASKPAYDTLSYAWGLSSEYSTINLHGKQLSIGRNLHHALRDLRQPHSWLLIWTDAICINQSDDREQSHQVQQMGRIYSDARVVHAWLDHRFDPKAGIFEEINNSLDPLDARRASDKDFWDPAVRFLQNPYWKRMWIQQELILAREILVHSRGYILNDTLTRWLLDIPSRVFFAWRAESQIYGDLDTAINGHDYMPFFMGLNTGREFVSDANKSFAGQLQRLQAQPHTFAELFSDYGRAYFSQGSLLNLFLETAPLQTSEPRDLVYALLGLAIDVEEGDVVVDYDLPVAKVYSQVAELYVNKYKSLVFLCFYKYTHTLSNSPSWLPTPQKLCEVLWLSFKKSVLCGAYRPAYGASIRDSKILSVRGIRVDKLTWTPSKSSIAHISVKRWRRHLQLYFGSEEYLNDDDIVKVLFPWWSFKTLQSYSMPDLEPSERRTTLTTLFDMTAEPGCEDMSLVHYVEGYVRPRLTPSSRIRSGLKLMEYGVSNEVLFGTADGRLGCVGRAAQVKEGDEVWALYGCPIPLILRPPPPSNESQYYEQIGCISNVSNLMSGEGFHGFPDDGELGFRHGGREIQQIDIG